MENLVAVTEKVEQIKNANASFLEPLKSIVVRNEEDYNQALTYIAEIKSRLKLIKKRKDEIVGPFKEQMKAMKAQVSKIEAMFDTQAEPMDAALTRIETISVAYFREQKRKEEEQRQEAERLRQEELDRLAAEQKRKEEEARKLAEEAKKDETKNAELEKKQQEISDIKNESAVVETMPLVEEQKKTKQTTSGKVTMRELKKFEIIDRDQVPDQFWIIDEVSLRKYIMSNNLEDQPDMPAIPGVRIYIDFVPAASR